MATVLGMANPSVSPNRSYIPAVDHMRAFAALLILFYHGFELFYSPLAYGRLFTEADRLHTHNPLAVVLLEGETAVSAFMVLSGFIFMQGTTGKEVRYGPFLRNRLLRIYPLYGLMLLIGACAYWEQFNLLAFLQSVLPLANFGGRADYPPWTGMSWTVAVECQFYLLFPILFRFLESGGPWFAVRLFVLLTVLRLMADLLGANARDLSYWTIVGRLDQFLLGMLAGRLYALHPELRARRARLLPVAVLFLVGVLWGFHEAGGWFSAAPWKAFWPPVEALAWVGFLLCYLPAGQLLPQWISGLLCRVGQISYSIYLLHVVVITIVLRKGWLLHVSSEPAWNALLTTALILLPLTLGLSTLSYATVEAPFLGLRRRYAATPETPHRPERLPSRSIASPMSRRASSASPQPATFTHLPGSRSL